MDKGLIGFLLIFLLLITASVYMGNADQITPTIAQAQADISIGAAPVQAIEQGLSFVAKALLGAFFAGVTALVFTEGKKIYKAWIRNSQTKRWQAGPNAQWKQQTPKTPSLTRTDLLFLALSGKVSPDGLRSSSRAGKIRPTDVDNDIDLEF